MNFGAIAKIVSIIKNNELPVGISLKDSLLSRELTRELSGITIVDNSESISLSTPRSIQLRHITEVPLKCIITDRPITASAKFTLIPSVYLISNVEYTIQDTTIDEPVAVQDTAIYSPNIDGIVFVPPELNEMFPPFRRIYQLQYLINKNWVGQHENNVHILTYYDLPIYTSVYDIDLLNFILYNYNAKLVYNNTLSKNNYQQIMKQWYQNGKVIINTSSKTYDILPFLLSAINYCPVASVNNKLLSKIFEHTLLNIESRQDINKLSTIPLNDIAKKQFQIIYDKFINPYSKILQQWNEMFENVNKEIMNELAAF